LCDGCRDQNINTETAEENGGHREIGSSAGEQVAEKGFQPFPQGLKPIASQALIVGAKAPTP